MTTFPSPRPVRLTGDFFLADVRIVASDRADCVVEIRPRNAARPGDQRAAEQTTVDFANDRLVIRSPRSRPSFLGIGRREMIEVTVALPTGSSLEGETMSGTLDTEGQLGDVQFTTGNGRVVVDRAASLVIRTGNGDIQAGEIAGRLDLDTGNGAARVRSVGGPAIIKTANGAVEVDASAGDLRVKTANGAVTVGRALGPVNAKTANGAIRVDEIVRGAIQLETAYGEIEIGIRQGTAAWLDVRSHYGRVRSDLGPDTGPSPAAETAEVRARTSYGEIIVRRPTGFYR